MAENASLPTPLSPVMSTVRSVPATCVATASAWLRAGALPIIPKRALMLCTSIGNGEINACGVVRRCAVGASLGSPLGIQNQEGLPGSLSFVIYAIHLQQLFEDLSE